MTFKGDLTTKVRGIYKEKWETRDGQVVPKDSDLKLSNNGVYLDATILYADLDESTNLAKNYKKWFAAEQYKAFLWCATKTIRAEGGHVRSFDGDRVMGIFVGDSKNTSAVKAGLKINWVVKNIIEVEKKKQYPNTKYKMRHVVGIDTSQILASRSGIRGSNDIVWVGNAANYAAKLSSLSANYPTWITYRIYDNIHKSVKYADNKNMWEPMSWTSMNNLAIYRSNYFWSLS